MKLFVLAIIISVALAQTYPGYIINFEKSGTMKPKSLKDKYTEQSFANLLKNNFQVLSEKISENVDLIEEFGKGNLINPVEMNYLFVIEGEENVDAHLDNARVQISQEKEEAERILDSIFNINSNQSLVKLAANYFPQESRAPFYYYKSSQIQGESPYEKIFGIELKRDVSNNEVFFFDNQTQQKIGNGFELQSCIKKNFREYSLQKDRIVKRNSSLVLDINEENVKDVENFLKDLCAVSKLSQMFKKSQQPNLIAFVLNFKSLEKNELVQDIMKNLYRVTAQNFAKSIGAEKTFGEIIYVPEIKSVEQKKTLKQSRILAEETKQVSSQKNDTPDYTIATKQIKAWFSLALVLTLFFVAYGLFNMEIQRDSLLYAKFIAADGAR